MDEADFTDAKAVATIVPITSAKSGLLNRLIVQIERILRVDGLNALNDDVVEAARSTS